MQYLIIPFTFIKQTNNMNKTNINQNAEMNNNSTNSMVSVPNCEDIPPLEKDSPLEANSALELLVNLSTIDNSANPTESSNSQTSSPQKKRKQLPNSVQQTGNEEDDHIESQSFPMLFPSILYPRRKTQNAASVHNTKRYNLLIIFHQVINIY